METMVNGPDAATLFWDGLAEELSAWQASGQIATFWWRDDDAAADSPALTRLTALSTATGVPVAVAAVPKLIEPSLPPALAGHPTIWLLQHGFAHIDHANGLGEGAWELGAHRPRATVLAELEAGREIMAGLFGAQFLPVIAAPWNHIDPLLMP